MNNSFPRIITLLRKEKNLSQKQVAADLGISQALLSHYEKGIRECGLEFVVKVAQYYKVSCDYLLGMTPDRNGTTLNIDDIPEADETSKDKIFKGSLLPTLNKKLIVNSINITFDILQKCGNKGLVGEVSAYLMLSVYKMFRILYSMNPENPQGLFATQPSLYSGLSSAAQCIAESTASCIASQNKVPGIKCINKEDMISLNPDIISKEYPLLASSLYNLIQSSETRMGVKKGSK